MDPKAHKDKLVAAWSEATAQASELRKQLRTAQDRATFLQGAIAAMNDFINDAASPESIPTDNRPIRLSRAERRRLRKEKYKMNGASEGDSNVEDSD